MTKVIALFNHKGGVSKTTTTFNLGWKLAQFGLKTLIVDADPQCNLTASVLGLEEEVDLFSWYNSKDNEDIYSRIEPIVTGNDVSVRPIKPAKTKHENLYLIAGNIKMSELDINMAIGLANSEYNMFAEQFVGAFNACVRKTIEVEKFDIVLIDMSPSASALNRCILMGCDYFVIPTSPDFFCYQAIQSLSSMLPDWANKFSKFRDTKVKNYLPENPPKLLGLISQRFRKYKSENQTTAKAYQQWINKIQQASLEQLAPELLKHNMIITPEIFKEHVQNRLPYNLIDISDFNTLIAKAQNFNKPVYALTETELNESGNVKNNMQANQKEFDTCFTELAESICRLTGTKVANKDLFDSMINQSIKPTLE